MSKVVRIRAVIFDLDGVVTDTAEYHYRTWKRIAAEIGVPFDRDVNDRLRGMTRPQSLRIVLAGRQISAERFDELLKRKDIYYHELMAEFDESDLLPGIDTLLDELREAGVTLAVGSASRNARRVLERLDVAEQFALIAGGDSVERPKPAPDLFLYVADRLDVQPHECVVVEDSEAGVEAALRGGFWVVGIGPEDRVGDAHRRLESTAGLSADQLLTLPYRSDRS